MYKTQMSCSITSCLVLSTLIAIGGCLSPRGASAGKGGKGWGEGKGWEGEERCPLQLQHLGVMVVVPRLDAKEQIALNTHRGMGRFGVHQVLYRLQTNHWWRGMGDMVVAMVKARLSCVRPRVGCRESVKELQLLPIRVFNSDSFFTWSRCV